MKEVTGSLDSMLAQVLVGLTALSRYGLACFVLGTLGMVLVFPILEPSRGPGQLLGCCMAALGGVLGLGILLDVRGPRNALRKKVMELSVGAARPRLAPSRGAAEAMLLLMAAITACGVWIRLRNSARRETVDPLVVLGLGASLAAIVLLPLVLRRWLGWLLLRRVHVRVSPARVRSGGAVDVEVPLDAQRAARVQRVSATLEGREVAIRGSGEDTEEIKEVFHSSRADLGEEGVLDPESAKRWAGQLVVPAGAAGSFDAPHARLEWEVTVRVEVPPLPDWIKHYPLRVI